MSELKYTVTTGPAAAAFLAAGIGCLMMGVMAVLTEASGLIKHLLDWYPPAGPLTGKVISSLAVWLIAWASLHFAWRSKNVNLGITVTVTLVLIALAFLATFPPIFQLVER